MAGIGFASRFICRRFWGSGPDSEGRSELTWSSFSVHQGCHSLPNSDQIAFRMVPNPTAAGQSCLPQGKPLLISFWGDARSATEQSELYFFEALLGQHLALGNMALSAGQR
jgi:hypothetical protein